MPKKRVPKRGPDRPGRQFPEKQQEAEPGQHETPVLERRSSTDLSQDIAENTNPVSIKMEKGATTQGTAAVDEIPKSTSSWGTDNPNTLQEGIHSTTDNSTSMDLLQVTEPKLAEMSTSHVVNDVDLGRDSSFHRSKDIKLAQLLLSEEKGKLDSSLYPVLVVNSPSDVQSRQDIETKFGFTSRVDWKVVFDCDPNSNKTGLCKFVRSVKDVKILSPEKFEVTGEKDIDTLRGDIDFPVKTTWVFPNGRNDVEEKTEEKMGDKKWTKSRSKAVQKTVDFFTNPKVISGDRAVVIFLLLSHSDLSVMCSIFQQFFISESFQINNFTVIAENEDLISKFVGKLEDRDVVEREDIDGRCLGGHPWHDISSKMTMLVGPIEAQLSKLPNVYNGSSSLPLKDRKRWSDVSILTQDECEKDFADENDPNFEENVGKTEQMFYQGYEAEWANFYLSEKCHNNGKGFNHVLQRDAYKKLKNEVDKILASEGGKTNDIPVITVYHQAGAGGTTVAKHVLWDLHREIRCAVVTRPEVTKSTVKQIKELREYGYDKKRNPGPVVLLVDNLDSANFSSFVGSLEKEGNHIKGQGFPFVVLHCKRVSEPETLRKIKGPSVAVQHKLSRGEIRWFKEKTVDLEKREVFSEKDSPELLLGFMVMKHECDQGYLTKLVTGIMPRITKETPEEQMKQINLLKYISVVQMYKPDFAMPVSACDSFMSKKDILFHSGETVKTAKRWEKHRPSFLKILLIEENIEDIDAGVKGLRVVHPTIVEIILEQLCDQLEQKVPEMFLELLESAILRTSSHSKKYVEKECRHLMVHRLKREYGDGKETDFAPFIEDACHEGKTLAFRILQAGIDQFRDSKVAQQKARLHKREGDLDSALKVINIALELQDNSSYIWCTKGHILQKKMTNVGHMKSCARLTSSDVNELMEVFDEASNAFRKAQEVMKTETTGQNYAGFFFEMVTIFQFLGIIQKGAKPFCFKHDGEEKFRKYLVSDYIPTELGSLSDHHETMKNLKRRFSAALSQIEDYIVQCSYDEQTSAGLYRVHTKQLGNLYENRKKYFGFSYISRASDSELSPTTSCQVRRGEVMSMKAASYYQIFGLACRKNEEGQHVQVLKSAKKLLVQNLKSAVLFDAQNLVFVSVALAVCCDEHFDEDEVRMFVELLKEKECETLGFYGLFFEMLLNWHDATIGKVHITALKGTVEELKRRWMRKYGTGEHGKNAPVQDIRSGSRGVFTKPMKPKTEFYLGRGQRTKKLVYRKEIFTRWEKEQQLLERLEGFLKDSQYVRYRPKGCAEPIDIRLAYPIKGLPSEEQVQFYLGFSFAGPIAYDPTYIKA